MQWLHKEFENMYLRSNPSVGSHDDEKRAGMRE
jgi:hypothetical protein